MQKHQYYRVIVNKLNAPVDEQGRTRPDLSEIFDDSTKAKVNNVDPAKLQESSPLRFSALCRGALT